MAAAAAVVLMVEAVSGVVCRLDLSSASIGGDTQSDPDLVQSPSAVRCNSVTV